MKYSAKRWPQFTSDPCSLHSTNKPLTTSLSFLASCYRKVRIGWGPLSALDAVIDCARGEVVFFFNFNVVRKDEFPSCSDNYIFPYNSTVVITMKATQRRHDTVLFQSDHSDLSQKWIALFLSLITLN